MNPRGSETERCLARECQAIGGGKKKPVFWLGKKKEHPWVLTHTSLTCLELTGFLPANVSHGSDDLRPCEQTLNTGQRKSLTTQDGSWQKMRAGLGGRSLRLTNRMSVDSTVHSPKTATHCPTLPANELIQKGTSGRSRLEPDCLDLNPHFSTC